MVLDLKQWEYKASKTELSPEKAYRALLRNLRWTQGFGINFVECSPTGGEKLIQRLRQDLAAKRLEVLRLSEPIDNLFEIVRDLPEREAIEVLFIVGLEKSLLSDIDPKGFGGQGNYYNLSSAPPILEHLNWQRDNFRDYFPQINFVFLLPYFGIKYFIRRAPDFFDWRSSVTKYPIDRELVERNLSLLLQNTDYDSYQKLTAAEREERFWAIETQLGETCLDPHRKAELCREQGRLLEAGGDTQKALTCYNAALRLNPEYAVAYYNRVIALNHLGRHEEAIASFDQVLHLQPDDPDVWFFRGYALYNLGRHEEAIASYDQTLYIKPDDHYAWCFRGLALDDLGRYEEAIASYDQALHLKPDDPAAWNNRGVALRNLGRYEEAIASFEQALHLKPDKHEAWTNRGNVLSHLGRHEEAIASYDQALHLKPDLHEAWYGKAWCFALQGNVELALENLQRAIDLSPNKYREMAKTDADFASLRDDARFQSLVG